MAGRGLRIWSPLVAVCLGGLMLAACGKGSSAGSSASSTPASKAATGSQSSVASKKPVVIGASLSLSGDFSADGQAFQRGYELWADYVNHHGGLLGHPVKLDILSDASSPTQAVTNYEKLISSNHVALTFGPFSSLLTIPTSKVAARYGYAFVEGAGGAPDVFAAGLHNLFDVATPVANYMLPFAKWVASLPPGKRPKTAAYPTSNDPFTEPVINKAKSLLQKAGVRTVYYKVFPAEVTDFTPLADQVATTGAQMVVLGSVDVPTVSAFMQAFEQQHYNPKVFIASAGPDQGQAFLKAVGTSNANGVMVPNGWYPGVRIAASEAMVKAYVAKYGGSPSGINADVAEAFSVGQVVAQAVKATHSLSNAKIISYLHSGVKLSSVEGPVKFDSKGENIAALQFIFQWQHNGHFVQVLPTKAPGSQPVLFPKPAWGS